MIGLIIFITIVWMVYELWRAPLVDENFNIVRPTKTFKDLFKKSVMKKLFEVILFVLIIALGITILTFGFRMLFEAAKQIF